MDKTKVRRTQDRRNRDQDVLDAGIKVFYAKGYAAASVQDVADVVGVLKGSLYHYISSKEDLLFRIFEGSHAQAVQIMDAITARDLPPRQRIHAYLAEIVRWYLSNIERVSLYFNEWRYLTGDKAELVLQHRRVFAKFVYDMLIEGSDQLRRNVDPRLAHFYILGAINNIPVWYRRAGPYSADEVSTEFASMSVALALTDDDRD